MTNQQKPARKGTKTFPMADREAVRAVVQPRSFEEIDGLRISYPAGERGDEVFWRLVLETVVAKIDMLPSHTKKLLAAKVAAAGGRLGLTSEEVQTLVKSLDVPALVEAALCNSDVQRFQADTRYGQIWAREAIAANPPMRVEFEHAVVLGTISEAGDIGKSKRAWGKMILIQPLRTEDRLFPRNITYFLKPSNPMRIRWEFRANLKGILKDRRGLVATAIRMSKRDFIKGLSVTDAAILRSRLNLEPGQFWQAVHSGGSFAPNASSDSATVLA